MNGRIIGISIDGEFVPCETGCSISIDGEMIPTSSHENGNWRQSIAGYRSWKVSVNGNLEINSSPAGTMELIKAIKNGSVLELIMTMRVSNAQVFVAQGRARATNITIDAPSSGAATWSGSFDGQGELGLTYTP